MDNLAHQDETLYELLNGNLVAMSPRPAVNHNIVAGNIFTLFHSYLKGKPCKAFSDGVDVYLTENDRVIPDMMVVCNKDIIKTDGIHGSPDLVVEVLSPSTAKNDKGYKKELYAKCSIKEYWIVDTENRSIEVYQLIDNRYELKDFYNIYPDFMINKMTEEEKQNIAYEFTPILFPDLNIAIKDVFDETI